VIICIIANDSHAGSWLGIKPIGKNIVYSGVNVDRVIAGRIVEHAISAYMPGKLPETGVFKVVGEVK